LVSALRDLLEPIIGKKAFPFAFPLLVTFFIFILVQNWMGLLPGVGTIGRATTAARGAGRVLKETQDVGRAKETVAAVDEALVELDKQFKAEAATLGVSSDPLTEALETLTLRPTRQGISVRLVTLAWAPCWRDRAGAVTPAWE
jgi:hypothetical protein